MPRIILTADVEDGASWERSYRTHGDLFKSAGIDAVHYTVGEGNHVVMCTDVADVSAYMAFVEDAATQEAMKHDGVKRDSVKLFVLDRHFPD